VLAFKPGEPVERRVRAILLDMGTGAATDVVASLTRAAIDSLVELDPAVDGQPPIMLEDLVAVDEIVKADSGWRAAMARRGITALDLVRPCPLSAGAFGIQGEEGRRMLRVLSFVQEHEKDHPWAHPVDGLVAYVDLVERRVLHLIDQEVLPVPEEPGNFDDPAEVGPARTSLKPIHITQPEGPSFAVDGDEVTWEGWRVRIGFDAREGLTLHQLSLWDRPVVYRASVAEMMVPYADPGPARFWQNYFDAGEYLLGQQVVSLMLGCDCLGEIRMTVDGVDNAVDEVKLERVAAGPDNRYGNAFTRRVTRLTRESGGARTADASVGRAWHVVNPSRTNRLGQPVAYALDPQQAPLLAADAGAAIAGRASFATRHLWVTRYDPAERYAAGDLPNQHPGGAGLPAYVAADRDIDGQDIVLWHTFGMTHFPRPEDWPVMPVAHCGFTLRPVGFFDRNPVLDLPR
jgi:Cu2+-containing amine oxidase